MRRTNFCHLKILAACTPIYGFVTERRYRLSFYFRWLGRLTPSCAIARTLGIVRLLPETESASRRFSTASADRRKNVSFGPWARPLFLGGWSYRTSVFFSFFFVTTYL